MSTNADEERRWTAGIDTGDWEIHGPDSFRSMGVGVPDKEIVCILVADYDEESGDKMVRRAHLIAAAPELYRRLEEATDLLQRLLEDEAMEDSARSEVAVAITYYRDAMKRARGDQP